MSATMQAIVVGCLVVVTLALVAALLAVRRLAVRAESVLGILEQELRPLVSEVRGLSEELRRLTRDAHFEIEQIGVLTERVGVVVGGLARAVTAIGEMTRAGRLLSVAIGLKRGVDVFVHQFRKGRR
jgi:hypothetical protein